MQLLVVKSLQFEVRIIKPQQMLYSVRSWPSHIRNLAAKAQLFVP